MYRWCTSTNEKSEIASEREAITFLVAPPPNLKTRLLIQKIRRQKVVHYRRKQHHLSHLKMLLKRYQKKRLSPLQQRQKTIP